MANHPIDIALRVAAAFSDKTAKRKTFLEARAEILEHLKKERWKVVDGLKVPHATSPDGTIRVWFKAQAVYVSYSSGRAGGHNLNHARSLWFDIRTMDPHDFEKKVEDSAKESDKFASSVTASEPPLEELLGPEEVELAGYEWSNQTSRVYRKGQEVEVLDRTGYHDSVVTIFSDRIVVDEFRQKHLVIKWKNHFAVEELDRQGYIQGDTAKPR